MCRRDHGAANRYDSTARRIGGGAGAGEYFLLDVFHEILDLTLHLFRTLAHLQDDGDPADVYTQVAGQGKNKFQPLQVFVGIKPGVTFSARGLEQTFTLIESQGLRMNLVHLGDRRDHVSSFGFALGHQGPLKHKKKPDPTDSHRSTSESVFIPWLVVFRRGLLVSWEPRLPSLAASLRD